MLFRSDDIADVAAPPVDATEDVAKCEALLKELQKECLSAFQDAHNTGFYINEYTTKIHSLGDKLLEGLRRASEKVLKQEEIQSAQESKSKAAANPKAAANQKERERIKAVLKKFVYLMNSCRSKAARSWCSRCSSTTCRFPLTGHGR